MNLIPHVSHIDIRVPTATTEQEFLRLAVQAAARKFRELQANPPSPVRHLDTEIIAIPPKAG